MPRIEVIGLRSSDVAVGVYMIMINADALEHERVDKTAHVSDALFVGFGAHGTCDALRPSLHTCKHHTAYCGHVGPNVSTVYMSLCLYVHVVYVNSKLACIHGVFWACWA